MTFLAVYLVATIVLVTAELTAVFNDKRGDTITEKVQSLRWSTAAMVSLLTWAWWHFTLGSTVEFAQGVLVNVLVVAIGFAIGLGAYDSGRDND